MFWCCCIIGRVNRHILHLTIYGLVASFLIISGIVFTIFAIFQKDSQIGKVWLSGPVLIVVGAVLCGKVMIDWGPAMERRLSDSVNSQLYDEFGYLLSSSTINAKEKFINSTENAQCKIKLNNNNTSFLNFGAISSQQQISSSLHHHNVPSPTTIPSNSIIINNDFIDESFDQINYGNENIFDISNEKIKEDKATQVKLNCEKCEKLWDIIKMTKRKRLNNNDTTQQIKRQPKVIGNFVFSELILADIEEEHQQQNDDLIEKLPEQPGWRDETNLI